MQGLPRQEQVNLHLTSTGRIVSSHREQHTPVAVLLSESGARKDEAHKLSDPLEDEFVAPLTIMNNLFER